MATRLRIDHDLDPNGHRILGGRGADVEFTTGGDLSLGQGNGFRVSGAGGATTLRRIATANWLQASTIDLQFLAETQIANGTAGSGGYAGITTPGGATTAIEAGSIGRFILIGDSWVLHTAGASMVLSREIPYPDIAGGDAGDTSGNEAAAKEHRHPLNISPTTLPLKNGVATVGDGGTYADILHTHPEDPPAVDGSTLYTASVPSPLLRAEVRGLLPWSTEGIGPPVGYTAIPGPYTWKATFEGPLMLFDASGLGTIFAEDGDRVLSCVPDSHGDYDELAGIYEVVDCGIHNPDGTTYTGGFAINSKAIIRRAADANTSANFVHGMTVKVTGTGVQYAGKWFTLDTAGTISLDTTSLKFVTSSSYPLTDTAELLTGAQLTSEGASGDTLTFSATLTSGETALSPGFLSLAGTPGVTTLTAGPYTFHVEDVHLASVPAGTTTTISAVLTDYDGGMTAVLTSPSTPILATSPTSMEFQGLLSSPYTISPTGRLLLQFFVTTDSSTPVTATLRYSSSTHGTWMRVPFQIASGLSSVPAQNVTSGLLQTGVARLTTVAGIIPMPTRNSLVVTVDAGLIVNGMKKAGLASGTPLFLLFTNPCRVVNGATVASDEVNFYLTHKGTAMQDLNFNGLANPLSDGRIVVTYYGADMTDVIPAAPCLALFTGGVA